MTYRLKAINEVIGFVNFALVRMRQQIVGHKQGQEELKQPTARLLSPALDSVSPQPPAELHLRKENYHPPGWAT